MCDKRYPESGPVGAKNGPKGALELHHEAHEGELRSCNDGTKARDHHRLNHRRAGLCSDIAGPALALATIPLLASDHSQGVGPSLSVCVRPGPARSGFPRLTEVKEGVYARSL